MESHPAGHGLRVASRLAIRHPAGRHFLAERQVRAIHRAVDPCPATRQLVDPRSAIHRAVGRLAIRRVAGQNPHRAAAVRRLATR